GHARPPLDVAARRIESHGLDGVSFSLETPEGDAQVRLALPGLYNVYNALAAASRALALGVSLDIVVEGLERFTGAFGRFERFVVGDKRLLLLLVKNPTGAKEAIRTLQNGSVPATLVVALNDEIADGRDVSWIWDVDFEPLLEGIDNLVASGSRAAELALRFAYGGLDESRIVVEPDLERALDHGLTLTPAGGELVVLPTYTAMLGLQRLVAARGLAKPYWERAACPRSASATSIPTTSTSTPTAATSRCSRAARPGAATSSRSRRSGWETRWGPARTTSTTSAPARPGSGCAWRRILGGRRRRSRRRSTAARRRSRSAVAT